MTRPFLLATATRTVDSAPTWLRDAIVELEQAAMWVDRVASTERWHEYATARATLASAKARLIRRVLRALSDQEGVA